MQGVQSLPPVIITCGQPFRLSLRVEDPTEDPPDYDLSGYGVEFWLAATLAAEPFHLGTGEIAGNRAIIEIDPTTTEGFAAVPLIGGRPNAVLQITLTAPLPLNSIVLQGPAVVQGVIA